MEDEGYQDMIDYENDIYDLHREENRQSQDEKQGRTLEEKSDSDTSEVEQNSTALKSDITHEQRIPGVGMNGLTVLDQGRVQEYTEDDDDSSDLSDDERDLIYSRLYYSASTVPISSTAISTDKRKQDTKSPRKSRKRKTSKDESAPLSNFTFHLDLDNPSDPTLEPQDIQPPVLNDEEDEDEDYPVPFPLFITNPKANIRGRYFAPPAPERPA